MSLPKMLECLKTDATFKQLSAEFSHISAEEQQIKLNEYVFAYPHLLTKMSVLVGERTEDYNTYRLVPMSEFMSNMYESIAQAHQKEYDKIQAMRAEHDAKHNDPLITEAEFLKDMFAVRDASGKLDDQLKAEVNGSLQKLFSSSRVAFVDHAGEVKLLGHDGEHLRSLKSKDVQASIKDPDQRSRIAKFFDSVIDFFGFKRSKKHLDFLHAKDVYELGQAQQRVFANPEREGLVMPPVEPQVAPIKPVEKKDILDTVSALKNFTQLESYDTCRKLAEIRDNKKFMTSYVEASCQLLLEAMQVPPERMEEMATSLRESSAFNELMSMPPDSLREGMSAWYTDRITDFMAECLVNHQSASLGLTADNIRNLNDCCMRQHTALLHMVNEDSELFCRTYLSPEQKEKAHQQSVLQKQKILAEQQQRKDLWKAEQKAEAAQQETKLREDHEAAVQEKQRLGTLSKQISTLANADKLSFLTTREAYFSDDMTFEELRAETITPLVVDALGIRSADPEHPNPRVAEITEKLKASKFFKDALDTDQQTLTTAIHQNELLDIIADKISADINLDLTDQELNHLGQYCKDPQKAVSKIGAVEREMRELEKVFEAAAAKQEQARKEQVRIKREQARPKKDAPKKDEPKKDEPKKDEPKKDEPKKDETKKDEPKKDEPKKDAPKKDETKKDEPKKDEPKKDEPKKDAPKKDETKKDEPKAKESKGMSR